MSFEGSFNRVVVVEGGYSNNPADSGGKTMYGITEQVARANGYTGPMDQMPLDNAKLIYRVQYWNILKLPDINNLSEGIADKLFDIGVNCGVGLAGQFLQRTLNVLNRNQSDYPDLKVDNVVGPVTVTNLAAYLKRRGLDGVTIVLRVLNSLQGAHYVSLAEKREKDEAFVNGWFLNRIH